MKIVASIDPLPLLRNARKQRACGCYCRSLRSTAHAYHGLRISIRWSLLKNMSWLCWSPRKRETS